MVDRVKWEQVKNRRGHCLSLFLVQSHTAAAAPCGRSGYAASCLVAHPNRPGVIFTHTPQVRNYQTLSHLNVWYICLFNFYLFFAIAFRFAQPTSSRDQKWSFYVAFGRCCTLNLRRRVERDLRRGRWTNQRPQTDRGSANELQWHQEVTSGCRFGSPVPLFPFSHRLPSALLRKLPNEGKLLSLL